MKIKKFKLNKDTKLIITTGNNETRFALERKGTGKTKDFFRFFVNKCDVCGETFLTKSYPENTCEKCQAKMRELDKEAEEMLNKLKPFLDMLVKGIKSDRDNIKKECECEKTTNNENVKVRKPRKKYTFKHEYPMSGKYAMYIEEHKGNVVVPKNIDTIKIPSSLNKLMLECFFDCVYKGKSMSAIASIFNIKTMSVGKYLSNMSALRLVYPAGDGLRYKVMPDVEVKTI